MKSLSTLHFPYAPSLASKMVLGSCTSIECQAPFSKHGNGVPRTMYRYATEKLKDDDVDKSIHNLTSIGADAMCKTDEMILKIMTSK